MNVPLTIWELIKSNDWLWQAIIAIATAILAVVACIELNKRKKGEVFKKSNDSKKSSDQVKVNIKDKSSYKTENNTQIGNVSGGSVVNNNVVNTSVSTNGFQADDVIKIVREFNKQNSDNNNAQLEPEVNHRFDEFESLLGSKLREIDDKLNRFAEPSVQRAVRDAVTGYVKNGGEVEGEALVDLLIERVKVEEHTSKQSIIDEAIKLLPTLSNECIAVLAILSFVELVVHRSKEDFDKYVRSMNSVLDLLPKVNNLDIQYLLQVNCLSPIHNYSISRNLVIYSKSNYPLAFCRPVDVEHSEKFMKKNHICWRNGKLTFEASSNNIKDLIYKKDALSKIFNFNADGTITPLLLNMDIYKEVLHQKSYLETMFSDVRELLSACELQSDQEIASYYESLNPNWALAMSMLTGEPLNKYDLQPLGLYIGARKIFKLAGVELPIEELL